jgi:hypothetical protein
VITRSSAPAEYASDLQADLPSVIFMRKTLSLFTALLAAGLMMTTPASADTSTDKAAAQPAAGIAAVQFVQIKNLKSGMCLAVGGGSTAPGAHVIQWPCEDDPRAHLSQLWEVTAGLGWTQIENWNSRQCLAIGGGSMQAGAGAIQWPCGSGLEQRWDRQGRPLPNVNSHLCLAVENGSRDRGARAIQFNCIAGAPEQNWTYDPA